MDQQPIKIWSVLVVPLVYRLSLWGENWATIVLQSGIVHLWCDLLYVYIYKYINIYIVIRLDSKPSDLVFLADTPDPLSPQDKVLREDNLTLIKLNASSNPCYTCLWTSGRKVFKGNFYLFWQLCAQIQTFLMNQFKCTYFRNKTPAWSPIIFGLGYILGNKGKCERGFQMAQADKRNQFAKLLIYLALLPSAQMWPAQNASIEYQQEGHKINKPHSQISKEACRWAKESEITNYTPVQHGHKWAPLGPVRINELKRSTAFASECWARTGDQMIAEESSLQVSIRLLCVPVDKDQLE